jgi:hypothetical protein
MRTVQSSSKFPLHSHSSFLKQYIFDCSKTLPDRAMAQAVSLWPLNSNARVLTRVSLCGICGGLSGTATSFLSDSSVFLANIIPFWLSTGDKEQFRWWLYLRDIASPNRHDQQQQQQDIVCSKHGPIQYSRHSEVHFF